MASSDKDFLETWADIDRTILFDATWVMTSYWLNVPIAPAGRAWTYGDVTCKSPFPLRWFLTYDFDFLASPPLAPRAIRDRHSLVSAQYAIFPGPQTKH